MAYLYGNPLIRLVREGEINRRFRNGAESKFVRAMTAGDPALPFPAGVEWFEIYQAFWQMQSARYRL